MRAILVQPDHSLLLGDAPSPPLGSNDLRIAVRATSVNRADLLQRIGKYPPPPGASEILGLECAGVVAEAGANVRGWSAGDRAMALLAGGGYARRVARSSAPPARLRRTARAVPPSKKRPIEKLPQWGRSA
jgi:NADPH:quinone reductase-like Zn-dependent oxidoreductase